MMIRTKKAMRRKDYSDALTTTIAFGDSGGVTVLSSEYVGVRLPIHGWRCPMGQFSEILMDHFNSPRNSGRMDDSDLVGLAGTPGSGPYVALYLRLEKDSIIDSRFQTHGCGVSVACASMLTELIGRRTVSECLQLTQERLVEALDGVPSTKLHCPALAIAALKDALKNFGASP
jgi:nitrogen fixation protein NifU and related proteins